MHGVGVTQVAAVGLFAAYTQPLTLTHSQWYGMVWYYPQPHPDFGELRLLREPDMQACKDGGNQQCEKKACKYEKAIPDAFCTLYL